MNPILSGENLGKDWVSCLVAVPLGVLFVCAILTLLVTVGTWFAGSPSYEAQRWLFRSGSLVCTLYALLGLIPCLYLGHTRRRPVAELEPGLVKAEGRVVAGASDDPRAPFLIRDATGSIVVDPGERDACRGLLPVPGGTAVARGRAVPIEPSSRHASFAAEEATLVLTGDGLDYYAGGSEHELLLDSFRYLVVCLPLASFLGLAGLLTP